MSARSTPKLPAPPSSGVRPTDQINLTDEDSRIMPATGKGFEQSYNAQAAVDTETMPVVATDIAQVTTDKQRVAPMLEALAGLPNELGRVKRLLGDNGFFSAANVENCVAAMPDGYALLAIGTPLWVSSLMLNTPYEPVKAFSPISLVVRAPNILVVHPSVAANSVEELIVLAKARAGLRNGQYPHQVVIADPQSHRQDRICSQDRRSLFALSLP